MCFSLATATALLCTLQNPLTVDRTPNQSQIGPYLFQSVLFQVAHYLSPAGIYSDSAMASNQEDSNAIIVGIDFGTTYSGVAFTMSNKIDKIEVVTSWSADHHSNVDMEKVPTAIAYREKNTFVWGYDLGVDDTQLKWFKLLLIDQEDLPDDVRTSKKIKEARKFLKKHNKTSVEVISLYLRHLWNHASARIVDALGRSLVNFSKFHIVITLPAIWPEYAQARMREAATRAGILSTDRIGGATELSFISEPEAAALATLYDMDGRCDIKVRGQNRAKIDYIGSVPPD